MTRTEHAHLAIALAVVLGCQAAQPSVPPSPSAVEPPQGFEGSSTTIEIVGTGFHVRAVQRVGERESRVVARYRAWVVAFEEAFELEEVVWLGPTRLRARVPAGLPVGRYDVAVEGPYGRGSVAGAFEVLAGSAPALSAALILPPAVNVGQQLLVEVTADNAGDAPLQAVRAEVALGGTGALAPVIAGAGDLPRDLAPGERKTFTASYRAETTGSVSVQASVLGSDPRTGATVAASAGGEVLVQRPATLVATLSAPPGPLAVGELPLTVTVTNRGEATAVGVLPVALTDGGSTAALVAGPAPSEPVSLAAGASATFTWTSRVAATGRLTVTATVRGLDANDGGVRTAAATASLGSIAHTTEVIAPDPFRDGSPFAFVAPLRGQVYVGPSSTGTGIVRMQRDGSAPESLELSFALDTAGNAMGNTATPHRSIGYYGCQTDSLAEACGPDDEDGRGLLTSVSFAGEEWLVLGGARLSGDLDYVYLGRASASPLAFSYVDLSQLLGGNTRGFSAAFARGERLYLGFPDNGGNRPYGVALLAPPPEGGGLDARAGIDAIDLNLHDAYAAWSASFASVSMVDAIAELGGRLYFFNDAGCLVSTSAAPATKDDFRPCSPASGAEYDRRSSVEPTRQHDLEPGDRAWPQAVAWQGRLYAIRNTYTGPQLWTCDPAGGGTDPVACEAAEWRLLAADPATLRTRLGHPGVTAASMLLATPTHLYVGLDDPVAGLHVLRTRAALPAISDFEGLGGAVFGAPGTTLKRIFDAKVVTGADGRADVFLTAGDGNSAVSVIRMDP
ncbi:hypothetical protein [Anaeromyxobacter sp. Fw109-5]|uniref:hypothetical protein n=1 Tax=Anaeromyxobacter sp. (strain Fw109-5) TaxID=404589 RepID=UPI0000ED8B9B|nr:hypothetical protein [Anaeromyxobacter sp. Fw109-5]ABS26274.1 hypothetical protein Anae109_2071 [Anaeromyxobacter sp. Fw109-5]